MTQLTENKILYNYATNETSRSFELQDQQSQQDKFDLVQESATLYSRTWGNFLLLFHSTF